LGLATSIAELEPRGFDVRCAAWTTWSRLSWREPVSMDAATVQRDEAGRGRVLVGDLDAERSYVVELRTCAGRGSGAWCRVNNQPICTAVNTSAPLAPELVKNTPHTLTFSFASLEDRRVVAYEVRRYEGWMGGWGRASPPVRFDEGRPEVRITSERRWVVTIQDLQSETTHALQLRGVTQVGGITSWSAWSEPMTTLRESDDDVSSVGPFSRRTSPANATSLAKPPTRLASKDAGSDTIAEVARSLEAIIAFTADYATAGVQLPSVTVPPVEERAAALLREHAGSVRSAVDAVIQSEDDALWTTKLPDFLTHQAPVAGCSTLLLRELWHSLPGGPGVPLHVPCAAGQRGPVGRSGRRNVW